MELALHTIALHTIIIIIKVTNQPTIYLSLTLPNGSVSSTPSVPKITQQIGLKCICCFKIIAPKYVAHQSKAYRFLQSTGYHEMTE
jgi:hypothetical protein